MKDESRSASGQIDSTLDRTAPTCTSRLSEDPAERVTWVRQEGHHDWEYIIAHQSRHLWTLYHETYTICSCINFSQEWRYRGRNHTLPRQGVMMMEPGELHRTLWVPQVCPFNVAIIPAHEVIEAARELGFRGTPHLRTAWSDDPMLAKAVFRLGHIAEGSITTDLLETQTLQAMIVHRLLLHTEQIIDMKSDFAGIKFVARARDYLCGNTQSPVTLDDLATYCGIGRYRLVRTFKQVYGMPPHAFHIQVRIERARGMLRQGTPSVQVAAELGFADQAHFIRFFKRIMRVTPKDYALGRLSRPGFATSRR